MNKDRDAIMKGIDLGIQIEAFVTSDVGKYLIGRAQDSAMDAVDALKTIDPKRADEIRELQNAIYRAESFEVWLAEGISIGKANEELLQQQDQSD